MIVHFFSVLRRDFRKFLLIVSLLFLMPHPAAAATVLSGYTPSSAEEVGFMFYKLAGIAPDFKRWVVTGKEFRDSSYSDRPAILDRESIRLKQAFYNYKAAQSLIVVKAQAEVFLRKSTGADGEEFDNLEISFDSKDKVPYFPFDVAGQIVSVIVQDFQGALQFPITHDESDALRKRFTDHLYRHDMTVDVIVKLRATQADAKRPVTLDGKEQWLMMTDLASISVWKSDDLLLEHNASWYEPPVKSEIRNLYRE